MNLSREQMTGILGSIQHHIETRFFNPLADVTGWTTAWNEQRSSLLASASSAEFEQRINTVLGTLKSSHVAFFHGAGTRVPAPYALNATFLNPDDPEASHWVFLDVLEGGMAQKARIVPGDALLAVNAVKVSPPDVPRFDLGKATEIVVRSRDGGERAITIDLPRPTAKGRPPLVEVTAVHSRKLTNDIGYVRVAYFPWECRRPIRNSV